MHNSTKHFKIHTHVQDLSTFSQYSTNISTRFNTFQNFQHYLQLYTTLHHFAKLSFVQKRLYIILQTLYTILQSSTQLKHKNSTQFYNTLQISTALYKVWRNSTTLVQLYTQLLQNKRNTRQHFTTTWAHYFYNNFTKHYNTLHNFYNIFTTLYNANTKLYKIYKVIQNFTTNNYTQKQLYQTIQTYKIVHNFTKRNKQQFFFTKPYKTLRNFTALYTILPFFTNLKKKQTLQNSTHLYTTLQNS